jgi:hypothetical protein
MRKTEEIESWVVYRMALHGKQAGGNAVCGRAEWEELEAAQPGFHTLIRSGIANETEAELLARGTSGDAKPNPRRRRT